MPVIGTAGHVDHGKSTLVLALTGRDPDRWDEEKRRGLTIDLGFAWTELAEGLEVGFVDVPGHERFIKNMLAGIDGIDVALFVVAADEGWMPQSEEHLAVLDLLGVRHGVVAVTRVDLVDAELAELAALEVEERLEGTSLAGAPVVPVAAPIGTGLAELRAALTAAVQAAGPAPDRRRPRLWVDRSFVISGAGTVVTGTLTGGTLSVGDTVAVWPGEHQARIRSLQSHEHSHPSLPPGTRAAANLVGLDRGEIARGGMVGLPGQWRTSRRFLAHLRPVRRLDEPVADRGAYHLHLGSGAWPIRIRLLGDLPDSGGPALVDLEEPLPMAAGDRFIVREVGRRAVVAGGRVLDPRPPRRGADLVAAWETLRAGIVTDPDQVAARLLQIRGREAPETLAADSGGGSVAGAFTADGTAFAAAEVERLAQQMLRDIQRFHDANPLRPGVPKASLASGLSLTTAQVEALAAGTAGVVDDGATVRLATFGGGWDEAHESAWQEVRESLAAAGLAVPRLSSLPLDDEMLHALLREGRLVRVEEDLAYLPEQIEVIERVLGDFTGPFTVGEFRDRLDVSRRQAVPILEWLDRTGRTVRQGDTRTVR